MHLHDFQNATTTPARVIATAHDVAFGFPLDALCAVDVCWAASDARISIEEVDVGLLAADKGTLARVPKPIGNASLLHESAQSARTFGAEDAWRSHLDLVSRVFSRRATCVRIEQTSRGVPQAHHKHFFFPDVILICHSGHDWPAVDELLDVLVGVVRGEEY